MTFNFEKITVGKSAEEQFSNILQFLNKLVDKLNYHLNHIDEQNLTQQFAESLRAGATETAAAPAQKVQANVSGLVELYKKRASEQEEIELLDAVDNYRMLRVKFYGSDNEVICTVGNEISGNRSVIIDGIVWLSSFVASYSSNNPKLIKIDNCRGASIVLSSGIGQQYVYSIDRIWGYK